MRFRIGLLRFASLTRLGLTDPNRDLTNFPDMSDRLPIGRAPVRL